MKPAVWIVIALVLSLLVGGYALMAANEPVQVAPVAPTPVETAPPPADPVAEPVETAPAEPVDVPTEVVVETDDNVRRIDLTNNPSFFALFDELGIDDVEGKLARWGLSRGYPQLDEQGNPILDQPYEQYDDATLLAFADSDDMWAQQFLAARLADTNPTEAIEWYRRAAENGSVHAMTEMARLYRDLQFRPKRSASDDGVGEQINSLRSDGTRLDVTGYAWAAVAERAGWDPLRGGMTAGFVGAKLSDAQREQACEMAESLYSSLSTSRSERGLGDYPSNPPPVVFDPGAITGTGCASSATPTYESQCREVQVNVGDQISRVWTCDEPGQ